MFEYTRTYIVHSLLYIFIYFTRRFYSDIRKRPKITDEELSVHMQNLPESEINRRDINAAWYELYNYYAKNDLSNDLHETKNL